MCSDELKRFDPIRRRISNAMTFKSCLMVCQADNSTKEDLCSLDGDKLEPSMPAHIGCIN